MSADTLLEPLNRLAKDIKAAAKSLTVDQARYLVDAYYSMQGDRIGASNQAGALEKTGEPHEAIDWLKANSGILERNVASILDAYSVTRREGRWARSQIGVGPVLTAGLLAHIDIERAKTAGQVWRFAGLDPTVKWEKGQKRPWNARLKVLCWKLGESFKKTSGHAESIYGKVYQERKALEVSRNLAGTFADQAAATLEAKKIRDKATRAKYDAGLLPDGRLDLRAMRYAVKLFLSHYHHVAYEVRFNESPPKPYILTRPEHAHFIAPPGWPCE